MRSSRVRRGGATTGADTSHSSIHELDAHRVEKPAADDVAGCSGREDATGGATPGRRLQRRAALVGAAAAASFAALAKAPAAQALKAVSDSYPAERSPC